MAHKYAEVEYESRGMDLTLTGTSQTFVLVFCIDPEVEPYSVSSDEGSGLETPYWEIFNYDDNIIYDQDVVALEYAYDLLPEIRMLPNITGELNFLILSTLKLENVGPYQWKAVATYSYDESSGAGGTSDPDDEVLPYVKIGFTIGGGSKEITKSLEVKSSDLSTSAVIPSLPTLAQQLIGATGTGVKGTTVPNSTFRLQITAYYKPATITLAFAVQIQNLISGPNNYGTYNNAIFLGTAVGETQLLSASGGGTVVDIIPITFEFDLARNREDVTDEGFSNLTALGHDLVDYRLVERYDAAAKLNLQVPEYRIVHRIADPVDYSLLKLPIS